MTDRMMVGNFFPNAVRPTPTHKPEIASGGLGQKPTFESVLHQQFIHFSHHAEMRMQERGIQLKPEQLSKIDTAIQKAQEKGAKDSLILLQDMALIVNIKNRTVITAMEGSTMKDNVFTQIDSAVIIA